MMLMVGTLMFAGLSYAYVRRRRSRKQPAAGQA